MEAARGALDTLAWNCQKYVEEEKSESISSVLAGKVDYLFLEAKRINHDLEPYGVRSLILEGINGDELREAHQADAVYSEALTSLSEFEEIPTEEGKTIRIDTLRAEREKIILTFDARKNATRKVVDLKQDAQMLREEIDRLIKEGPIEEPYPPFRSSPKPERSEDNTTTYAYLGIVAILAVSVFGIIIQEVK